MSNTQRGGGATKNTTKHAKRNAIQSKQREAQNIDYDRFKRRNKIMNPIAFALVLIGILLLMIGLLLLIKRKKVSGIVISLLGFGLLAAPFLITFLLYR